MESDQGEESEDIIHFKTVLSVVKHYYAHYVLLSLLEKIHGISKKYMHLHKKSAFYAMRFSGKQRHTKLTKKVECRLSKLEGVISNRIRLAKTWGFFALLYFRKPNSQLVVELTKENRGL